MGDQLSGTTSIFGLHLWLVVGICVGVAIVLLLFVISLWFASRRSKAGGGGGICSTAAKPTIPAVSKEIQEIQIHPTQVQPDPPNPLSEEESLIGYNRIHIEIGKDHRIAYPDRYYGGCSSSHGSGEAPRSGGGGSDHPGQTQGRESIAAKLVANLITEAGANRVLACDLHSGQSMGYFDIPVDHVYGQPVILDYLASKTICSDDLVVVSPDVGGVARARAFAKKLSDAPLAIVDKRRHAHNVAEVMNLIGDVKGKVAVMVDDMIDTAGTIAKGAALLHQEGAREVYACCTHAVFSPPAIERLSSGLFQEVIITNTIPVSEQNYFPQLTVLSVANLLGETIWRVHDDCSGGYEPYSSLGID